MAQKKTALIVGMAKSGIASAILLYKNGYNVIINDMKTEIAGLRDALSGIEYVDALGKEPDSLLDGIDLLVLSPVVPIFKPFAKEAKRRGIDVIGEIELGYRFADKAVPFVCISGTNGKTTTTALTGEIFKNAWKNGKTYVLGNIGIPITEHSMDVKPGDVVVAEVAALQLESIDTFRPHAFGMLNITEDHLNRFEYKIENYIAAKCRGFENQNEDDFGILNYDDAIVRDMAGMTRAKVVFFSQKEELSFGTFVRENAIIWKDADGKETVIADIHDLLIPGRHNVENALCAISLSMCMGLDASLVREALLSFKGVEHRSESVREKDGILYYNDSKGTNPDSTIKAVETMKRPTILMLGVGNYDKKSDFLPLFKAFNGKIKGVVASGINVPAIMDAAKKADFSNIKVCDGTFREMIEMARDMADEGYAVLLSPAAASWGQFSDYEERGRIFKDIVNSL